MKDILMAGMRKRLTSPLALGAAFFVCVGLLFVVYLAFRGADAKNPPSAKEAAVLAVFAALAQIIASYMWSLVGRAHPAHARSAVRRLARAQVRAVQFSAAASRAYEEGTLNERRLELGRLSSGLDAIAEDLEDAISDWREFHSEALENLRLNEESK